MNFTLNYCNRKALAKILDNSYSLRLDCLFNNKDSVLIKSPFYVSRNLWKKCFGVSSAMIDILLEYEIAWAVVNFPTYVSQMAPLSTCVMSLNIYIYRYKTQDKSIKMANRLVQNFLRISFFCLNIYIKALFCLYSNFNIVIKINNSNYYKFKNIYLYCVPYPGYFKRNILKVNTTLR